MANKTRSQYGPSGKLGRFVRSALCLSVAAAAGVASAESDTDIAGFVENATYYRETRGLSKFRNTAQLEFSKALDGAFNSSSFSVNGTFRMTYDGVYDLNDDEWGDKAGGPVQIENGNLTVLGAPGTVPHGGGLNVTNGGPPTLGFAPFYPTTGFPWSPAHLNQTFGLKNVLGNPNPNDGLKVLGSTLGGSTGAMGMHFGVPVRPCDVDSRGCTALKDYMDLDEDELKWSDFNDHFDFIRELYMVSSWDLDNGHQVGMKLGKQQIVWGRTDLFRVLDVLNPVDYSRNNIYDELEDIRIPQWMMELEYRWGAIGAFDDLNLSFVWNFDEFRPANLGQAGTPNQILGAGEFFRGMANCWENGCTVSNFPQLPAPFGPGGLGAVDFGPGIIGIRDVDLPNWSLSNTQFGLKLEGVYNDVGFSFNFLEYRQQLPTLRGVVPSVDPFHVLPGNTGDAVGVWPYALAFDIAFPRVTLVGGSLDWYVDSIVSAFRLEMAWTEGEEFVDTSRPEHFAESEVFRWVLGWDRNTFIRWLNPKRAFLMSAQIFGQHLLEHNERTGPASPLGTPGKIGMPDHQDNFFFTFLLQGWYMNDRLNPQLIIAHDLEAAHTTIAPAIEWIPSNNWQITLRANFKIGDDIDTWDDARGAVPYPGLSCALTTSTPGTCNSNALVGLTTGALAGQEPLGRFRMGPLGMAQEEDEYQLTIRYRF